MIASLNDCSVDYETISKIQRLISTIGGHVVDDNLVDTTDNCLTYVAILENGIFTMHYSSLDFKTLINFIGTKNLVQEDDLCTFIEGMSIHLEGTLYSYEIIERG
jgi:hypothetical protein